MTKFENYHKHTTFSNFFQYDSATSIPDFINKLKERGCQCYFSTEHGYPGEWIYCYDLCKQMDIKFRYAAEIYWVKDTNPELKDNTNCHMVIIARTYQAIRKLNYIISVANVDGYYYKPRVSLDQIFTLTPDEVYITSACIAGHKYPDSEEIWLKIAEHFGDSFFFEYQPHNTQAQKDLNLRLYALSQEHGINTIVGLDTHYINDEDRIKRDNLLKRKDIHYDDEEGWYMDFPDAEEIFRRFKEQGALPEEEVRKALENTNIFVDGCQDIELDTEFKIPILDEYKDYSYEERCKVLQKILNEQYSKEDADHKSPERIEAIKYEFGEVKDSGVVDYFIDNYKIIKKAVEEYGGQLTTTSRGSSSSYYTNKLLGFTTLDRFEAETPIFPERFVTKERILESKSMPDIDNNLADQEPFIKAARDFVGNHGCYPLLAVGYLKEKAAFKMYAGVNGIEPSVANDITSALDKYYEVLKNIENEEDRNNVEIEDYITDKKLLKIFNESKSYQGIIDQARVHACGFILYNGNPRRTSDIGYGDIRYEIGLIRCHSESTGKSTIVANVEGGLLDAYGYVKDDFLIVDVVGIIYKLYHAIGRDVPTVAELRKMVEGDKLTWDLYAKGATCCLNQCEKIGTTNKVIQYKPQNVQELAAFIAGIRPGFKSLIDQFLDRKEYSSGETVIDELLSDSSHYMLYQESIMKVLGFLGLEMGETYKVIKAISKKKLKGERKEKLLLELKQSWKDHFGNTENFQNVWNVISDAARYSFNCVSGDTKLFRTKGKGGYSPTIEEMYLIANDVNYARETGHQALRRKYRANGYGNAFSMGEDKKIYKNKIVDIVKQPEAQIYLIITESGRTLKLTNNHKVPTVDGIKYVKDLRKKDYLFRIGEREKKAFDSALTEEKVGLNYPKKGEEGFRNNPNGPKVLYKSFRKEMVQERKPCECCGQPYTEDTRFEVHHKDFDRKHNEYNNYEWLCVSCHKKRHYEHGRTKQYENGIPTAVDKIKSIEKLGVETVYDISMSEEVAHNFVVDNGLVVCNSSHALSMAFDSLYEAWMKAHYTSKFYEVVLNHYDEKNDKDKILELEQEAIKHFGYKMGDYEYGKDNRKFNVDDQGKIIYPSLASIKGIGEVAAEDIYNISQQGYNNFLDIYLSISGTKINNAVFENLVKIGYFQKYGSIKKLLAQLKVISKWKTSSGPKKTISKATWEYPREETLAFATDVSEKTGKISDKQYRITDWKLFITYLLDKIPDDEYDLATLLKFKYEILGYIDYTNESLDSKLIYVTKLKTDFSPSFVAYSLKTGKTVDMKVHKSKSPKDKNVLASFRDTPFEEGNILYMKKCTKKNKVRKTKTGWEDIPGQYVWWLDDYRVANL